MADNFISIGNYEDYGPDGKCTGWIVEAFVNPATGVCERVEKVRPMTPEEIANAPDRNSDGTIK